MTILAIAALGQMLVVMQAGIDLSTAGVISLCGNVLVGVSVGSDHGLAVGILVCVGLGALVGLVNGILIGIVRLNPLIVTLAVGQIVLAYSSKYARENTISLQVPESLSSWASEKPLGISAVFWTGAAITFAVALVLRYTTAGRRFQAVGANPRAAWMAGLRVRTHVVFAYTAAGVLYAVAAILLAGVRISIDPAFGASYLLAPIAAVVLAGAALSGGLASATSTWVAALALTFLTRCCSSSDSRRRCSSSCSAPRSSSECWPRATGSRRSWVASCGRSRTAAGAYPKSRKTRAEAGS